MKFKDQLKIFIFPKLIRILHAVGCSYEKLGNISFFAKSNLIAQAKRLGDFAINENSKRQNIYVLLILSGSNFHLYIESLLALGLKKKGHKITFIIDRNQLPIHELKKIGNERNWDYQAEVDFVFASKFLKTIGLEYITISEFLKDIELTSYNEKYNSILEATLLKQYKVGVISKDLPLLNEKTDLIKKAIAISEGIGNKLVRLNPDSVIMSHDINLKGSFLMSQKITPYLKSNGGGVIVNISSTYGNVSANKSIYGQSGINSPVAYATSKAAIINLTRYLATHLAEYNIRANVLSPGGVFNNQSEEFLNNYKALTPLKRMAIAEDYQGAILFLMSNASSYMTGANLIVDGGWTAW